MSTEVRWRIAPGATFRWRHWDDEYVLYHENSGDTHRLNAIGARALELLAEEPIAAGNLVRMLGAEFDRTSDSAFPAEIAQLLVRLRDLGLTEDLDDCAVAEPAPTA